MKNIKKPIGIIGGMGPFASAELLKLIFLSARNKFGARRDGDFPEVILASVPVESFFVDRKKAKPVPRTIKQKIKLFEQDDVCCFGIACNTIHILADKISKSTDLEFISIIKETVKTVEQMEVNKVGLLASPVTIHSRLYQEGLEKKGIEVLLPGSKQIGLLGDIIAELVARRNVSKNRKLLSMIASSLVEKGAQAIVLRCTELPLAFPKKFKIPVINTIKVLADSLVERCYLS